MNGDELSNLIDGLIAGEISLEDHEQLQQALKASPDARREFRQRMDLEAGLRDLGTRAATGIQRRVTETFAERCFRLVARAVGGSSLAVVDSDALCFQRLR